MLVWLFSLQLPLLAPQWGCTNWVPSHLYSGLYGNLNQDDAVCGCVDGRIWVRCGFCFFFAVSLEAGVAGGIVRHHGNSAVFIKASILQGFEPVITFLAEWKMMSWPAKRLKAFISRQQSQFFFSLITTFIELYWIEALLTCVRKKKKQSWECWEASGRRSTCVFMCAAVCLRTNVIEGIQYAGADRCLRDYVINWSINPGEKMHAGKMNVDYFIIALQQNTWHKPLPLGMLLMSLRS